MILSESILDTYLHAYRNLIAVEQAGSNSATISLPLHLASNHRIEITVTEFGSGRYLISDSARTLSEVQAAGYSLGSMMKARIETLASLSGLMVTDSHLVLETSHADLGPNIQKFLEVTKTIGDVYLVLRPRETSDAELVSDVRSLLDAERVKYKLDQKISGELESHPFDIFVYGNGTPAVAVNILSGQNTHNVAQIWGFKCEDIKRGEWFQKTKPKLALVYDVRYQKWSEASRTILQRRADAAIPGNALEELRSVIHPSSQSPFSPILPLPPS
jgi:hypothetical protein